MSEPGTAPRTDDTTEGHGGTHAVAVARAHGVETMFTLSGAHVFPMYDGAVNATPPMRLLDVRHEQSAVFAAEATGKLTRTPGLAVLTAGPGVTNGVSAMAQASFSGSPLVVLGGRAPNARWGTGALQEFDHLPVVSSVTRYAATVAHPDDLPATVESAFAAAASAHRGPAFVDIPMDHFFTQTQARHTTVTPPTARTHDPAAIAQIADLIATAAAPVLVYGSDVWSDHAEAQALALTETHSIPTMTNGMGRGVIPARHPMLVTKARGAALSGADLVVVVGTPLDFRLGYGDFGAARVVHIADSPGQLSTHAELAAQVSGDLAAILDDVREALDTRDRADWTTWTDGLRQSVAAAVQRDSALLTSESDPIHPARIYGELLPRLAEDAVVIGDGGDFVSFAGKFVEPTRPGCWLDPGPFGCLGAGLGAAIGARLARPSSQVVLLLGDGAAGMSLIDIDTLVRHKLPVVIVVGNNGAWGLEKGPMQMLYGYDVVADLTPGTRYDQVATALGAGGEMVSDPREIGPALDRAFASGIPYLVNVLTDIGAMYPRGTLGI